MVAIKGRYKEYKLNNRKGDRPVAHCANVRIN